MKKLIKFLICLLFVLELLFPMGSLISVSYGYVFTLTSIPHFSLFTTLLSVSTVILSLIFKDKVQNKIICFLISFFPLVSLINLLFCIFECSIFSVFVCNIVSTVCSLILAIKISRPLAFKIIGLLLSILAFIPTLYLGFILLIFGNFSKNTVIKTSESPTGNYYAAVIDSDQGALGGNTLVEVYEKDSINALFFKIQKKPKRIYEGDWGEFENMQIYWKSNSVIVINSVEYKIQ